MYLTVHGSLGLLLAQNIQNPYLAFAASLASHFVLDLVPHGDELPAHFVRPQVLRRLTGAALLDGAMLASFLVLYLSITPELSLSHVAAGVVGAVLPDVLEGTYLLSQVRWLKWFSTFHGRLHNFTKLKVGWQLGLLLQCLTFAALWLLLVQHGTLG